MLNLKRYVPNGRVSTGLLVSWQGRLIWAVGQPKHWDATPNGTLIQLIGVGGGQEPGETLPRAVEREALEEANAAVRLRSAGRTVWVLPGGRVEQRDLAAERNVAEGGDPDADRDPAAETEGEPLPLMVWQDRITARRQDRTPYELDYIVAVYEGKFLEEPAPGMEVPALVHLSEAQFLSLLDHPTPLESLVADGAKVVGSGLPEDALVRLSGSALYLARHWDRLGRSR